MIHPSYTELMEVINEGAEIDDEPLVTSRYSVSTAVEEIYKGKVHILPEEAEVEEETTEENEI